MPDESGRNRLRLAAALAAPFDLRLHFGFELIEARTAGRLLLSLIRRVPCRLGEFRNGRFHTW
jgi:hypothetical protein